LDQSVVAVLQQSALAVGSAPAELVELVAQLDVVELVADQVLFQAGEPGDAAYLVLEGALEVRAADGVWLDEEGPGALVGEQALLSGTPRSATITAIRPVRLLRVDRARLAGLMARHDRRRAIEGDADEKTRNRLGKGSVALRRLLAAGEPRTFSEGEAVFYEGDPADGLHVVLAGRAEVVTDRSGEPVHLTTVYTGQCFGEVATLEDRPRTASVVARAGLRTAFVPAERVRALHAELPELAAFLRTLLRTYTLPRRGTLHQRVVFVDGETCTETVYALVDGRTLTALRWPGGRYTLTDPRAEVRKSHELATGTTVSLDVDHRVVAIEDAGGYDDIASLHALALDGVPLSVQQRRQLRKTARQAALQAPDAIICRCLGLSRATLESAVAAGAHTVPALQQATGCGTVCGSCLKTAPELLPTTAVVRPPATPAPSRLPRMPRLVPWLGNFSFSRDPVAFQRRGHARLGPVFGAHLMGVDFVFIDPEARPDTLARLWRADTEGVDARAAWRLLVGRLLGQAVLDAHPGTDFDPGVAVRQERVDRIVAAARDGGPTVDLVALVSELVVAVLCAAIGGSGSVVGVSDQLRQLERDYSAFGVLAPLWTPSMRRRVAARDALHDRLGPVGLGTLVRSHRNATMAVVGALSHLAGHTADRARVRHSVAEHLGGHPGLDTVHAAPLLVRCIAEAARVHGGGGIWRRVGAEMRIDGVPVPEGALVGALPAVVRTADGFQLDGATTPLAGAGGAVFDECFGARPSAPTLPERVAMWVLAYLVHRWDIAVASAPRRWTVPVVPGLGQPVGVVQVLLADR